MKRSKLLVIGLTAAVLIIFMFSGSGLSGESNEVIRIGMIHPITGTNAFVGHITTQGAKLAAEFINKSGGIMGRKIEIVILDGMCRPDEQVTATKKLMRNEVKFFFGGQCSAATLAMMPLVKHGEGIVLSSGSSSPSIPMKSGIGGNDYVFTERVVDRVRCSILAQLIWDQGNRTVAILAVDNDYGRKAAEVTHKTFKSLGGKVVFMEFFDMDEVNYLPYLTKIKGMKADAFFIGASGTQNGAKIILQAHEIGLWDEVAPYALTNLFTPLAWDVLGGGDIERGLRTMEGLSEADQWSVYYDTPENKRFVKAYIEKYNEQPADNSAQAFVAIYTWAKAIEMALKQTGEANVETVKEALKRLHFDSITGPVYFDLHNHRPSTLFLQQVKQGKPVFIKKYEPILLSWLE